MTARADPPDLPGAGGRGRRRRHGAWARSAAWCSAPAVGPLPAHPARPDGVFHRSPAGETWRPTDVADRRSWRACDRGARDRVPARAGGAARTRWRRSGTNERAARGPRRSRKRFPSGDAGCARRAATAWTWRWRAARWSRSWARAARGRARCCTCWARWTRRRRARSVLDGAAYGALGRRGAGRAPEPAAGLRVPVPPPAAGVHRAGERDDAAPDRRMGAAPRARARAEELLARGGLAGRMTHRPARAVGRRAAALRGGAGAGARSRAGAGRRADRATSTTRNGVMVARPVLPAGARSSRRRW